MKDIAIFGAGGFGKEVACHIIRINAQNPTWSIIGFFDDGIKRGTQISHFGSVLGGFDALNCWDHPIDVVIAICSPTIQKNIVDKITNPHINFPNIIAPGIRFNDLETFSIGKGNIINTDCVFSCDVSIGDFNILNGSVVLGHDVTVGSFNTFNPAVRISGEVKIGNSNFFGINSIVLQQIKVGDNTRLGAGSVLINNPKEGYLYIGNPAKLFNMYSV